MNLANQRFIKQRVIFLDQIAIDLDINTGFKNWGLQCQQHYQKQLPPPGNSSFHKNGYDLFPCFTTQESDNILSILKNLDLDKKILSEQLTQSYVVPEQNYREWVIEIFSQIFDDSLTPIIKNYFRSEFMVHTFRFNTHYNNRHARSFSYLWHRDYTSNPHLKGIVYLTDCSNSEAGTEVFDINTTHQINLNGYSFPPLKHRISEISPYLQSQGIEKSSELLAPPPGHMILFRPRDVLHRARYHRIPEQGRTTLSFMLAPSILPWYKTIDHWPIQVMQQLYGSTLDLTYVPAAKGEKSFRLDSK